MRRIVFLTFVIAALIVAGCGGRSESAAPAAEATEAAPAQATEAAAAVEATEAAAPAAEAPAAEVAAPGAASTLPQVDPLEVAGDIITAGSSTVFPLSEAVAEMFIDEGYGGNVTIDSIGTGGGFERFCVAGETDLANASRPIKDSERESCVGIGRDPIEFRAIEIVEGQ